MADYAYGALIVRVTGDTRQLQSDTASGATKAGTEAAGKISGAMTSGLRAVGGLGAAVGKSVATGLTVATGAAAAFGVESFKTAARVGEMDAALRAIARSNGLSEQALQANVTAIRKQGIEANVAQNLVAQFARGNLDLAKSSDLARVAQDAAVLSQRNSTDVLDDLVHGIMTQNTQVLRNAGITGVNAVQAQETYAKSIGKTRGELSEAEKAQAVLNAVLVEGEKISGTYAEAMTEPGKVLRSFKRVTDDIKLSVGQGLVEAFKPLILQTYALATGLSEALMPGGALVPVVDAIGQAVTKLIAPLARLVEVWVKWITNLKPDQLSNVVGIIQKFGPAAIAGAAGLSAIVAPSLLGQIPILGGLLTNLTGPLQMVFGWVGKLGGGLLAMVPKFGAMGTASGLLPAALSGPQAAIVGIVAAIASLFIASKDFREGVLAMASSLWTGLQPALSSVWEMIKVFGKSLWEIIKAIGDALGPSLKNLAPLLEQIGRLFGANLAGGAEGAGASMTGIVPAITGLIKIIGVLLDITTRVLVPIIEVPLKLMVWASTMAQVVHPLRLLGQAIEWLTNVAVKLWHWITGNSPGLIPAFQLLGGVAAQVAGALAGVVQQKFGQMVDVVSGATRTIADQVNRTWSGLATSARSAGTSMVDGLKSGLSAAQSLGGWMASNVTGPVTGMLKRGFGVGSPSYITIEIGDNVVEGLKQGLARAQQLGGWIGANVTGPVIGWIKGGLGIGSPSTITISIGADLIAGLREGLDRARELGGWIMSNVAGPIISTFKNAFGIGSPSRVMIGIGEDISEGFAEGISGLSKAVAVPSPLPGGFAGAAGLGSGGGATINVYPSAGQDEQEIAAAVSRNLAWAMAGGVA